MFLETFVDWLIEDNFNDTKRATEYKVGFHAEEHN